MLYFVIQNFVINLLFQAFIAWKRKKSKENAERTCKANQLQDSESDKSVKTRIEKMYKQRKEREAQKRLYFQYGFTLVRNIA